MINDRIFILQKHKNYAEEIINKFEIKTKDIILIGGCSGSGKTETSDCLQEFLFKKKLSSLMISLDDFYLVHPTIRNYNRKKQGLDSVGLKEIDWEILCRICKDFKENKHINFKRVHKYFNAIEHNTIETDELDILIIEGLFSNYLKKFNCGDISIFLDGNPQQTLSFRKERGKENEEDSFRQEVVQKEFNVICQLKRYADLIIEFKND